MLNSNASGEQVVLQSLVQNYVERNGIVEISKMPFYRKISNFVDQKKAASMSYCAELLGYKKFENPLSALSVEEVCKLRRRILCTNNKKDQMFTDYMTKCIEHTKDAKVHEQLKDINCFLKFMPKGYRRLGLGISNVKTFEAYRTPEVKYFVEYLLQDDQYCWVSTDAGDVLYSYWVNQHLDNPIADVFKFSEVDTLPNEAKMLIIGNEVFIRKSALQVSLAKEYTEQAMKVIAWVKTIFKRSHVTASMLPTLAMTKPDTYTYLLDISFALGMNYADLVRFCGCYVPDQVYAFFTTGLVIKICDDSVIYQSIDSTPDKLYDRTDLTGLVEKIMYNTCSSVTDEATESKKLEVF